MNSLASCSVKSTTTGKEVKADILSKSDKSIRVAFQGTDIVMNMSRSDTRKPYVGSRSGMEFTSFG